MGLRDTKSVTMRGLMNALNPKCKLGGLLQRHKVFGMVLPRKGNEGFVRFYKAVWEV